MLEQTFNKINDVISQLKGQSFTKNEIEQLSIELRDVLIGADIPYDYIKSIIQDMQQKLKHITAKNLDKKAVVGGLLQSYIDATFNSISGKSIEIRKTGITTIGMFGPNGVGKTTAVVKIANLIRNKHNKRVLCVSFDITRFAAQEQLKILCEKNDIEYLNIVENGIDVGVKKIQEIVDYEIVDVLIVDFAGISPDNIEGTRIWNSVLESIDFDEKIVVLDGTFGQNTIELIKGFDKILKITGFAVSKIDSDQKGGVFFAIATASDKPIYYVSTGEKINNIVPFNKRMISDALFNIGGLKNVISSFQESNKEYIQALIQKNKKAGLNYNDLFDQLTQLINFGKLDKVLSVLPHTRSFFNVKLSTDAYILIKKWISIIASMTPEERENIKCLNIDRMNRIARGSGTNISDVMTLQKKIEEINEQKVLK